MPEFCRRNVLLGAAALPLAGCARPADAPAAGPPTPGQRMVAVAEVPVGGGTIVEGTLITQPSPGVFKGFIARCTHAGCALPRVTDGAAVCPCHSSSFGLDGEVLRGPATEPLRPRAVTVRGTEIVAG